MCVSGTKSTSHLDLLRQLQGDGSPGFGLYALPPELQLWIDRTTKDEVFIQAFGKKGANGRVMADLLRYKPEAKVFPARDSIISHMEALGSVLPATATTHLTSSYVSPRRGLNGLPVLSH